MPQSDLERYLAGHPLNDENAALMEGRDFPVEISEDIIGESKANDPLTSEDREWLRRLIYEPGFTIFLRLLNSSILKREESARVLSSSDPLANKERIVNEWAYIACFKTVMSDIRRMVEAQVAEKLNL